MFYPVSGTSFSNKAAQTTNTRYDREEPQNMKQSEKKPDAKDSVDTKHSKKADLQTEVALDWVWQWGLTTSGHKEFYRRDDENVLILH